MAELVFSYSYPIEVKKLPFINGNGILFHQKYLRNVTFIMAKNKSTSNVSF